MLVNLIVQKIAGFQASQPPSIKPLTMNYELSAMSYLFEPANAAFRK
jgi:hypothetical protein